MRSRGYSYRKRPTRVSRRFYVIVGGLCLAVGVGTAYYFGVTPSSISLPVSKKQISELASSEWVYRAKESLLGSPPAEMPQAGSLIDESERAAEQKLLEQAQLRADTDSSKNNLAANNTTPVDIVQEPQPDQRKLPELIVKKQLADPVVVPAKHESVDLLVDFLKKLILTTRADESTANQLAGLVHELSVIKGFDPLFIAAFIMTESSFREDVVSANGKYGLMQIDAFRGEYVAKLAKMPWEGEQQLLDAEYNLELGLGYYTFINNILKGDQRMALMAYAFGPRSFLNAVRVKAELPNGIYEFADKVQSLHKKYQRVFEKFKLSRSPEPKPIQEQAVMIKQAPTPEVEKPVPAVAHAPEEPKKQQLALVIPKQSTPVAKVSAASKKKPAKQMRSKKKKLPTESKQESKQETATEKPMEPSLDSTAMRARAMDTVFQAPIIVKNGPNQIKYLPSQTEMIRYIISQSSATVTDRDALASLIVQKSQTHDVDPLLVAALIKALSDFDSQYQSGPYKGLFAMDSEVVKEVANRVQKDQSLKALLDDNGANIELHAAYLSHLEWRHSGNLRNVVMAFLWEPGLLAKAARTREPAPIEVRELAQEVFAYLNEWKSTLVVEPGKFE